MIQGIDAGSRRVAQALQSRLAAGGRKRLHRDIAERG